MSVRALRRGSIAASRSGAVVPNTTYTLYSALSNGYVASNSGLDVGALTDTTGNAFVGMNNSGPAGYEAFLAFDTSAAAGIITSVTLSLYGSNDSSVTDFTLEARLYDWGTSLANADFRSRAQLGALTLLASMSSVGWNAAGYNALTSEAAFLSNINQAGSTRFLLCSNRHRTSQTPTTTEYVAFLGADASGTSQDPKLVIEAFV